MKRHLLGSVAAAVTLVLSVSACGKGDSSDDDKGGGKSIKFMAAKYDENTQPYWEALIKDFQAKNKGYTVSLEVVDWEQIDDKVKNAVQTKQQPDVLNLNKFSDFARDGLIYKADEVLSPQTKNDFMPVFQNQSKYNGQMYGLPFISSVRQFFYNKEVFQKAGIKEPPKSWDEVKSVAQKLKGKVKSPLGVPLGKEEAQAEFFMWAMNNQPPGGWVDQSGKWTIDQQANVDTLSYLKDLNKAGLTQPNPETTNRKDVFNQFAQGQVGMLNGAVFLPKGFIDPVVKKDSKKKFEYGIAPLPSKDGTTHNTFGVVDFLMAFKKGDNKEATGKFLDFLYSKDNAVKFLKTEGFLPVTQSAATDLATDEYLKPFVEALPQAKFAPTDNPAWVKVDTETKAKVGTAVANADPKKVLSGIQKNAEKGS